MGTMSISRFSGICKDETKPQDPIFLLDVNAPMTLNRQPQPQSSLWPVVVSGYSRTMINANILR